MEKLARNTPQGLSGNIFRQQEKGWFPYLFPVLFHPIAVRLTSGSNGRFAQPAPAVRLRARSDKRALPVPDGNESNFQRSKNYTGQSGGWSNTIFIWRRGGRGNQTRASTPCMKAWARAQSSASGWVAAAAIRRRRSSVMGWWRMSEGFRSRAASRSGSMRP